MGVDRLRKSGLFPIQAFAVISEESMIPLCEKYDVRWVMHENEPLGRKKNFGLSEAMKLDWDYLIEIGSDNLIKTELLKTYAQFFGNTELFGCNNLAFIDSYDLDCRFYESKTHFGAGRCFSRSVFEKAGTNIWPDNRNRTLDNLSSIFLYSHGIMDKRIHLDSPMIIDIKSEENIWPFNYYWGAKREFGEIVDGLSAEEIEAIKALSNVEVES
jgi:hypothetical protein